jgi:hypothetical protein
MKPKAKTYLVIRKIEERYEVVAENKEEAKNKIENPFQIKVISEKITVRKF